MFSRRFLSPNPLLVPVRAALVIFGLRDLLPDHTQCLFQEFGGLFAVGSFESHGINLDFSRRCDNDFDSSVHDTLTMENHSGTSTYPLNAAFNSSIKAGSM
jgi:hypothetical protein